mmetsp:Transcript_115530/g.326580  ORF Transcript_115530/g.326580 Transcript_115530/m.326580 type:complete len:222 (-) Transcript_115530:61-726(-)
MSMNELQPGVGSSPRRSNDWRRRQHSLEVEAESCVGGGGSSGSEADESFTASPLHAAGGMGGDVAGDGTFSVGSDSFAAVASARAGEALTDATASCGSDTCAVGSLVSRGGITLTARARSVTSQSGDDRGLPVPPVPPLPPPGRPPRGAKRKRRPRGLLEECLHQLERPEVILLGVWWLIIFVITVYVADMGSHLRAIWRPLALLASIPVLFATALCILTM